MSPRQEEEFELVLGNKQLLSLFFLVVVLFGVFFSFGYTVGYNRGENGRTREVANAEPLDEPGKKVQLPDALFQDAPKPTAPGAATTTEPSPGTKNEPDSPPSPVTPKDSPPHGRPGAAVGRDPEAAAGAGTRPSRVSPAPSKNRPLHQAVGSSGNNSYPRRLPRRPRHRLRLPSLPAKRLPAQRTFRSRPLK